MNTNTKKALTRQNEKTDLFKRPFQCFVLQEGERPHQISNENKIPFGFQVKGHNVVEVRTLKP